MSLNQDIFYSLRKAYYTLLDGNITLDGVTIPVFAQGQQVAGNKYILIQNVSSVDRSIKVGTTTTTSMQITIFCKGDELVGNEHEDIGAQVLAIIAPYNDFKVDLSPNFYNIDQRVATDYPMPIFARDTTERVLERNIIIEHTISHTLR